MKDTKLFLVALLFGASIAQTEAQVVAGSSFFSEIVSDWHMGITADATGSAAIPVNLSSGGDGTVGVYDTSAAVKFQFANLDKRFITASLGYKYTYYDFSKFDSDFSSVNDLYLRLFYQEQINEKWGAFGVFNGDLRASSNGSIGKSSTIYSGAGVSYKFSDDLRAGFGLGAMSRMDKDWIPLPVGYVDWDIDKNFSVRAFNGIAVFYDVWEDGKFVLNFSVTYQSNYIRLKERNGLSQSVRDSYVPVILGATYNFTDKFYVSGSIGGIFFRGFKYRIDGDSGPEAKAKPAPAFYFNVGYLF